MNNKKTDNCNNLIINGDCLDILPQIHDKSVDYCLTSPPYNKKRNDKYSNFTDINNNWLQLNIDVINQLLRVTKKHILFLFI